MVNLSRYAEQADDLLSYEGLKQNWITVGLFLTVSLAFLLRYLPEQGMQYLQALDPYMIYRMSKHLALDGNLPLLDFTRYFPYATPTYVMNNGNIFVPAFLYNLGPLFFMDYLEWAQLYPALMGAAGVLGTYFLGKEIFDRKTGLASAFFLATIAGVMHRTSAGFFEKEPTGTAFMMFSMFFFVRAWKREEYIWGILSGIMMALFSVSWGGSQMLWLLYPMTVGAMLWANADVKGLVSAYTPLVLIGLGAASAINPGKFWFTSSTAILNIGILGLLWGRHLVEQLELVEKQYLKYYTPTAALTGLIALMFAPLYSPWLAGRVQGVIGKVTQSTGADIVAGTVAENQAASLSQIAGQLGALSAGNVLPGGFGTMASLVGNLNGAWPLAFIGVVLLGTYATAMFLRKWNMLGFEEEIRGEKYYKLLLGVTVAWAAVFSVLFQDPITFVVGPAVITLLGGLGVLYSFDGLRETVQIEYHWYYLLPLFWGVTNILGAVSRSRLVFLAAFPTAFLAGYTFKKGVERINELKEEGVFYVSSVIGVLLLDAAIIFFGVAAGINMLYTVAAVLMVNAAAYFLIPEETIEELKKNVEVSQLKIGLLAVIIISTVVINAASGFASAGSLGGSPNSAWETSLDYMREETPEGSVVLSWWDYGYWFESIGRRAAVADGGNFGYYTDGRKINYPLADYLTSTNTSNHKDFLSKHSVDYIVLDSSMIGKYSAVSQIHNRDNSEFESMLTFGAQRQTQRENDTLVSYSSRVGNLYVPYSVNDASAEITSAPTLETQRGRSEIDCVLTENGRKTFNTSVNSGYCVADHPYRSYPRAQGSSQAVLVPKAIADSTLVRLYIMDGYGIEYAEKVPEASNGYVKMWDVDFE